MNEPMLVAAARVDSVGGGSLRFPELSLPAHFVAAGQVDRGVADAAQDAARKSSETHADAVRVVIRAKAREGHDLAAMRPADALAIDIIRRALDDVRGAREEKLDDVFNATSPQAAIAKGAAVVRALGGEI